MGIMRKLASYRPIEGPDYRPNTRKMYEDHHGVQVVQGVDVHHVLPVRLGGKHEVENLTLLTREQHAQAHLNLYGQYGDVKDLCAHYMILGRTEEAALAASAAGGRESQRRKRERGDLNGFQLFDPERRKEIASKAGSIGGAKQRDLGIGIHVDSETRAVWAKLGAEAVKEQFSKPDIQASRGRRGGVKNAGFKWYRDGTSLKKYTARQQQKESFDAFIERTGFKQGRK